MIELIVQNPSQVAKDLAQRVKQRRTEKHLTQSALAKKSGVALASIRRFEQTGLISLQSLLQIAYVMELLDDFNHLFAQPQWNSLDDMLQTKNKSSWQS